MPRLPHSSAHISVSRSSATQHPQRYAACYNDCFSGDLHQGLVKETVPNWHYQHITDDVLPALRAKGLTEEQITTLMVDNPRRYFTPTS